MTLVFLNDTKSHLELEADYCLSVRCKKIHYEWKKDGFSCINIGILVVKIC